MSVLTMRRRRSRGGDCRRGDGLRPHLASVLAGAAGTLFLLHGTAEAQRRPSVIVDLGALDALPPAAESSAPPVHLHPPRPATPPKSAAAALPKPKPPPADKPAAAKPAAPPKPEAPAKATAPQPPTAPQIPPPPEIPAAPSDTAVAPLPGMAAIPPPPNPPPPPPPTLATATPQAQPSPASQEQEKAETERLTFEPGEAELSSEAKAELDRLASRLAADPHLFAQLLAYASDGDASQARRLSLSRALAARSYLVDRGVNVKQIDIRPLGNHTDPGLPADRVDLVTAER